MRKLKNTTKSIIAIFAIPAILGLIIIVFRFLQNFIINF